MNANENNNANTIQNQEVYDSAKEVMLQEGVIPKEIIKRNEVIREKKEMQEKFKWGKFVIDCFLCFGIVIVSPFVFFYLVKWLMICTCNGFYTPYNGFLT